MKNFQKQMTQILQKFRRKLNLKSESPLDLQTDYSANDIKNFVYLWNDSFNKSAIETGVKINFSEYFNFGASLKLILSLSGRPDSIFENEAFGTKILVYNIQIKSNNVRFELHFHEDRLFFLNYTYLQITDIEKELVIRSITEKYRIKSQDILQDICQSIIIDKEGNGILFGDKNSFSVNYLAPNSKVRSLTQTYIFENKEAI